jgi:ribonuclease Y
MVSTTGGVLLLVFAVVVLGILVGITVDRFLLKRIGLNQLAQAQQKANHLLAEAEQDIRRLRHERIETVEAELARREQAFAEESAEARHVLRRSREKLDERQNRLNQRIQRINEREQVLHKTSEVLDALHRAVEQQQQQAQQHVAQAKTLATDVQRQQQETARLEATAQQREAVAAARQDELAQLLAEQKRRLENMAGLTQAEARQMLLDQLAEETRLEAASMIKEIRDEARIKANREARKIILSAIQRTAASHAIENTVSVVNIQSDEMKGRIIGREGRNIRAFEAATGIEVIVDDTPEAVILSGFNPVRREVARLALTRLIQDGRIHPARIEEIVEKTRQEIEEEIVEIGERTVIDLNLHGLHPELIRLVGRMRYRTSYGQNLLAHSIETARIASLMASELGLDAQKARRAGLLHDIGKVVEEEFEGPHALVGMELCRKYKEDAAVCNAVGAHHDEIEMTTAIAPVVQAADAISGARPGARREALEAYIKRLEKLEELAGSFNGVERVFAIQAGREIRVIVNHDLVTDALAEQLAVDIARKIQDEIQYPGQIKVTVIREVRSVSYAK